MALHTDLPIYKAAYDLLDVSTDLARNMPRDFKVSLGSRIRDEILSIVVLICRGNVAREKEQHLLDLIEHQQVVELLLRLCVDKRLISRPQYAKAIALTTSIGKQANGWRKSASSPVTRRSRPSSPSDF
ncbi:four helix bundle protein [Cupriavidus metallidurans]|uniref:four helix bundle protein n=1 Tax=Cupriavidus metallidurans TaxID=119219 RepID=UPI000CE0286D|nr:four helix bundle protein [Cupriavidus metallidurans]AVA33335.1 four helix bundle protein [Cupriavidus metallidurans]